jgi:hypothetical protein
MSRFTLGPREDLDAAQEASLTAAEAAAGAAAAAGTALVRAMFDAKLAMLRAPAGATAVQALLDARDAGFVAQAAEADAVATQLAWLRNKSCELPKELSFAGPYKMSRLEYAAAHGDAVSVWLPLARDAPVVVDDSSAALYWASEKGRRALLWPGADVDAARLSRDTTPLHDAVYESNIDAVRTLLAMNPDLEVADRDIYRALHAASCSHYPDDGSDHVALAIATLLLDAGADVNAVADSDDGPPGTTPLSCAITDEMRALLIARGGKHDWE